MTYYQARTLLAPDEELGAGEFVVDARDLAATRQRMKGHQHGTKAR